MVKVVTPNIILHNSQYYRKFFIHVLDNKRHYLNRDVIDFTFNVVKSDKYNSELITWGRQIQKVDFTYKQLFNFPVDHYTILYPFTDYHHDDIYNDPVKIVNNATNCFKDYQLTCDYFLSNDEKWSLWTYKIKDQKYDNPLNLVRLVSSLNDSDKNNIYAHIMNFISQIEQSPSCFLTKSKIREFSSL